MVDSLWLLYDAKGWSQDNIGLTTDLLDILSSTSSSPERATQEVTLRTEPGQGADGHQKATHVSRRGLCDRPQAVRGRAELPQLFPVLRSLASY